MRIMVSYVVIAVACLLQLGGAGPGDRKAAVALEEVAGSTRLWTGVAVSREGRVFVNYPRWSADVPISVAEIKDGTPVPFPDNKWNAWSPEAAASGHFVCVQSVTVDEEDFLWILDPANPWFGGVIEGGPKLLKVDLGTNRVVRTIRFDSTTAPRSSYLNDMRIDTKSGYVYITDSGTGALIIVDEKTGKSRRLLGNHASTKGEGIEIVVGGVPMRHPDGTPLEVHSDGIALSPGRDYVYYQALTGRTLYRVPTKALRDPSLSRDELASMVEKAAESGVADGIAFGSDGHLYLTAIEENAIRRITPQGGVETVVQDPRLLWPDSFAMGADGYVYVTTSQIHLGPSPENPYRILRFKLP
jgi:sugar lactone lactonase YvrE